MKLIQILLLSVLPMVSCQNRTRDKTSQKHAYDTTKELNSIANINTPKPEQKKGDFLNFWQKFRTAVVNFDTAQIIEQTKFPFETRGSLDSDPTIEYSKKKFIRVFKAFLNQFNGLDLRGGTELDNIKKTEIPNENDIQNDFARIGDLVFRKSSENWKLTFAYLDYDTIDSLEK